jgi:dihydrofolate reductase
MRKLITLTQVALDGVMQGPGGPDEDPRGGFTQGGWVMPFQDAVVGEIMGEIVSVEFALLLGRRTYEIFAGYWPYADGDNPIAKAFNKATKYVVTNSLHTFDWMNTRGISGDAVQAIRRLKASDGPELHTWGSGKLLQTLFAADLVDEFRTVAYPVVLGSGKRLFEADVPSRSLALLQSRSTPKGVLFNTYAPAGATAKGSFQPKNPSKAELTRRKKLAAEAAEA